MRSFWTNIGGLALLTLTAMAALLMALIVAALGLGLAKTGLL
jgi:hypothetical protein